jgi:hypothetical protein
MAEAPKDPASLEKENAELKAKLEDYKKLEEDLTAKRVFDKARGYLTTWITLGGIILTLAGFVGYQSVISYFRDLAKKKADAITEQEMHKIVETNVEIRVKATVDLLAPQISESVYKRVTQRTQLVAGAASGGVEVPAAGPPTTEAPKTSVDWTANMPAPRDSGEEGSVVGFALATALEFYIFKATGSHIPVSAREIYYQIRVKEGTFPQDSGGLIKDGIEFLKNTGVVEERAWPYRPGEYAQQPPASLAREKRYKIADAKQVVTLDEMKRALDSGPAVGGLTVYQSFWDTSTAASGMIAMPKPKEQIMGGIAVCFVGYDDQKKLLKFANTWGATWGGHGFGYLPYDYFREQSGDCWKFRYAQAIATPP